MGQWMKGYLDRLERVGQENLAGGGTKRLELQAGLGKLTARERIDLLVDPDTFDEIGSLVMDSRRPFDGKARPSPSDGASALGRLGNSFYLGIVQFHSGAVVEQVEEHLHSTLF